MQEKSKKLKLTRESVRLLSAASARKVAGGDDQSDMTQKCIAECVTEFPGFCHSDQGTCDSQFFGCEMGTCGNCN